MEPAVVALRPERAGLGLATCLALLVVVKFGIAQLSPAATDGRAAAERVKNFASGSIDDVVYVDMRAMWALRFYLGVQVREAWARRTLSEPAYQPRRRLVESLEDGKGRPARVYVVNRNSTEVFVGTLRTGGLCALELGRDAQSVVYRAGAPGPAGCATRDGDSAARGR
jgi:hypothetical protein